MVRPNAATRSFLFRYSQRCQFPLALALLVAASVLGLPAELSAVERPNGISNKADVTAQLRADVEYLASEKLRGRAASDETIHEAAEYIAERMKKVGLSMDVVDGSPFQDVQVSLGAQPGSQQDNQITFTGIPKQKNDLRDGPIVAKLGKQMNPLSLGASEGDLTGKLVFAGYGITAPKYNYDDYDGIECKDAIVVVMRKEPGVSDPDSPFDGVRNTRHAYFATKVENAIAHGASAVMMINDSASIKEAMKLTRYRIRQEEERSGKIRKQLEGLPEKAKNARTKFQMQADNSKAAIETLMLELEKVERGLLGVAEAGGRIKSKKLIPVVSIDRKLIDDILQATNDQSLEELVKAIDSKIRPQSCVLGDVQCSLKMAIKPTVATSPNVIGVIEGKGSLKNETVVVGAHYDHVGMGGYGSLAPGTVAVHNGADDNASGTATILMTAQILKENFASQSAHRRIVFIAFTGEERGLIGSKYYVDHPLFPLDSTVAMVNLDMVGRLRDNELTLYGTGTADCLEEIVQSANEKHAFDLFKVPTGYGPSDHQSFYKKEIPVIFFFTGLHNDYHRPSDDFDKINFNGMTRITDMVSDVTLQLAVRKERPKYAATENRVQIRRQLTAYMGVTLQNRDDYVEVLTVVENGPAGQSLRAGDQLSRFGKRRVRTSQDVLDLLRSRSPGDTVKLQVIRDEKTLDLSVKLGKRNEGK